MSNTSTKHHQDEPAGFSEWWEQNAKLRSFSGRRADYAEAWVRGMNSMAPKGYRFHHGKLTPK